MAKQFSESDNKNWKAPFFLIWGGQAFSLLGSQLVQFALIWYLTKQTGSATVLAMATLVALLPQIFLGPFAGSLVDRWNRRRIMMVADAAIALFTLSLAILFALGVVEVWHIYAMMFLRSLGSAFHGPAFSASTSLMVPKEQLSRIQGINQTLQGGLNIFSAPLGALLLELLPMQSILAIDIVTATIAITPLFFIGIPQPDRALAENGELAGSFLGDLREGFQYVLTWPGLLIFLLMATLINFLLTPASALTPLLVSEYFGGGAIELGWLEAVFGAGVIIGGILLGIWGGFERKMVTVLSGMVGLGAGMAVVGLVPANAFNLALVGMLLSGLMIPIVNGSVGALLQVTVDPDKQGRVFTLVGSAASAMAPIGLILAGPLSDVLGIQTCFVLGGVFCSLAGLAGFRNRALMSLEDGRHATVDEPQASAELT